MKEVTLSCNCISLSDLMKLLFFFRNISYSRFLAKIVNKALNQSICIRSVLFILLSWSGP